MTTIKELHIWMQNRRMNWKESNVKNSSGRSQPGKRIILDIEPGTPVAEMKIAVAEELIKYKKELLYYYVVAVVERDDGEMGYRTIVPKVYVAKVRK